jgi:hypothetical protein
MKIRNTAIPLAVIVGLLGLNTSVAQSNDVPTWQFSVKFVCGQAQGEGDNRVENLANGGGGLDEDRDPVVPGVYETAINLHNPNARPVAGANVAPNTPSTDDDFSEGFRKKALVLYPPFRDLGAPMEAAASPAAGQVPPPPPDQFDDFERAQPPGFWVRPDTLDEDWGLEIDCRDIRAVLLGGRCVANNGGAVSVPSNPCDSVQSDPRAHAPLLKGYVVIEERSKLPLDVTALYSGYIHSGSTNGDTCDATCAVTSQGQPAGFSEEIETITPKKIDDDNGDDD